MGELITEFIDGSRLEFRRGKFDDFCVFEVWPDGRTRPPLDTDYFKTLLDCQDEVPEGRVYAMFVDVYDRTTNNLDKGVVGLIQAQADEFRETETALKYQKAMTMVYAGMLAENNKAFTKLGKRIKRLGMHVILCEKGSVTFAAHFMRGKGWREIDEMCKQRGF
jgi:hypothetical protein